MSDPVVLFYNDHPFPNDETVIPFTVRHLERAGVSGPVAVLVVGCGTGEDVTAAREVYPHAVIDAFDPSDNSIRLAGKRCKNDRVTLYVSSIETFTPDTTYDLIFCCGVLHHTTDPTENLRRMRSWLSEDGRLVLGVYHHARWDIPTDYRRGESQILDGTANPRERSYSWGSLRELVHDAGGEIVKTAHRAPVPTCRFMDVLYDAAFLYKGQQIMIVVIR